MAFLNRNIFATLASFWRGIKMSISKTGVAKFVPGISAIGGILAYFQVLLPYSISVYMTWAFFGVFCVSIFYLYRASLYRLYSASSMFLMRMHPWMGFVTLVIVIVMLVRLPHDRVIPVDMEMGSLFDSVRQEDASGGYLTVWGKDKGDGSWEKRDDGIAFTFALDPSRSALASGLHSNSVGGYLLSYDAPIDRRQVRNLFFSIKVANSDAPCEADVGIRIVLDDPHAGRRDREIVTHEIASTREQYGNRSPIGSSWSSIAADIGDFKKVRFVPPIPGDLNLFWVNKVVFFVTPAMATKCPSAKLLFREVGFSLK